MGEYKGVKVNVTKLEVTEEEIEARIQEDLQANATEEEVTDRPIQEGDTANIDYEGLLDGVAFEGGTDQGYDLVIGSGSFIPGFEEGLIGAKLGEKLALDVTFPKDYSSADLAGKAVVFNVTVNSIKKSIVPELTEAYVKENTDFETIEAYKDSIRTGLEEANQQTMDSEKSNNVITAIMDAATIKSLPETLTNYYTAQLNVQVEQQATAYGMDKATFITSNGYTEEQLASEITTAAQNYAQSDLLIQAIVQAEKMKITDEDYQNTVQNYLTNYGIESEEELLKNVSEDDIRYSTLMQKAYDFIIENAVVTYK